MSENKAISKDDSIMPEIEDIVSEIRCNDNVNYDKITDKLESVLCKIDRKDKLSYSDIKSECIDLEVEMDSSAILYGFNNGRELRKKWSLAELEKEDKVVKFKIPKKIVSINYSFLSGLFGDFAKNTTKDVFYKKYEFICDSYIKKDIDDFLNKRACLKEEIVEDLDKYEAMERKNKYSHLKRRDF